MNSGGKDDDCASVATLGSFGSSSWVAAQFDAPQTDESTEYGHECPACPRSFPSAVALAAHITSAHVAAPSSTPPPPPTPTPPTPNPPTPLPIAPNGAPRAFSCPHCGKAFTRKSEMSRHVGTQHDNRTSFLHCERCTFKHQDPRAFHKHVTDRHKRCRYCKNLFKQPKKHEDSCYLKPSVEAGQRKKSDSSSATEC